jgi:hypothetical protein
MPECLRDRNHERRQTERHGGTAVTAYQGELFKGDDASSQDADEPKGCSFDKCDRLFHARWKGAFPYCKTHYEAARQSRELKSIRNMVKRGTHTTCTFEGCHRPHSSDGFCDSHRQQLSKRGSRDLLTPLRSWVRQDQWGTECRYGTCKRPPHSRGLCIVHYGRGISQFARDAILALQGGRCGICRSIEPGSPRGWHLDHSHQCASSTHKPQNYCDDCVRGILCLQCNRHGLSWYEDTYRTQASNVPIPTLEAWLGRRIRFHGAVDSPQVTVSLIELAGDGLGANKMPP